MSAEEYHRSVDLSPVKGSSLPAGREVKQGELRALFQVCETDCKAAAVLGVRSHAGKGERCVAPAVARPSGRGGIA